MKRNDSRGRGPSNPKTDRRSPTAGRASEERAPFARKGPRTPGSSARAPYAGKSPRGESPTPYARKGARTDSRPEGRAPFGARSKSPFEKKAPFEKGPFKGRAGKPGADRAERGSFEARGFKKSSTGFGGARKEGGYKGGTGFKSKGFKTGGAFKDPDAGDRTFKAGGFKSGARGKGRPPAAGRSESRSTAFGDSKPRAPRSFSSGRDKRSQSSASANERLLLGPHAIHEALRTDRGGLTRIYNAAPLPASIESLAAEREVPVHRRTHRELDDLSQGLRHQGIIGVAAPYEYAALDALLTGESPLLVALDELTDPHNFGAIVRTAVALGADGIIITRHRSALVNETVTRTSAGATEHAQIAVVANLAQTLESLQGRGFEIVGLAAEGKERVDELGPIPVAGRVLVIGSEGYGIRRLVAEKCERLAMIPLSRTVASLNASVAAALAIYESTRGRAPRAGNDDESE